ncbi:MAG: crossover junction endodeoxyribonuclease RuvC [Bdellovibrionaceae bacterium]|nr:crossover junction endodeoxyribonuclease RuvC [Pseudobdellovibrionaceae bacterium]
MSIILGIDPGSQITGFGVIDAATDKPRAISHGIIQLKTGTLTFNERLLLLSQNLDHLLKKYRPDTVVVEKLFLGKNPDSAFKLGHARGICVAKAMESRCAVFEYTPREVKKTVTGSGGADKLQVAEVLKFVLKIGHFDFLDASDALALAYHHHFVHKMNVAIEQAKKSL